MKESEPDTDRAVLIRLCNMTDKSNIASLCMEECVNVGDAASART